MEKPAGEEPLIPQPRDEGGEEEDFFEDASDAGKVIVRRAFPRPSVQKLDYFPPPVQPCT